MGLDISHLMWCCFRLRIMVMETQKDSFNFVDAEHEVLDFWKKGDIFKKSFQRKKRSFVFYDGPPFATGLPHHGHLLAGTIKDIIPRYWTMKGFYVERRFGWDCHGLPIEHEIDKKLGMSAEEAVKTLGVSGYNNECRSIVDRYVYEWKKTTQRMGRWVDFENDYKTMDTTFMESVWWAFKELWKKNLIYQGTRVVPFSTSLGTSLSNFEANLNYQEVQDPAVTALFKLKDEETFAAVWTTTPWSFLGNLGLCVGASIDYVKVRDHGIGKNIIVAKERLKTYSKNRNLEIVEEFKGELLKGKKYEPLFNFFSQEEKNGAFQILNDSYVRTDTGTGIVSIAPAFGEDDNRVMKEADISSLVCPIDDAGKFTDEVPSYKGIYVKDADKRIIHDLKMSSKLYDHSTILHSYPFCYRSDTPLIYRAVPSWYVRVEQFKEELLKSNAEIHWVPGHIKEGRFGKWLEGAKDWSISRNRVWGTPLPIWKNEISGKFLCLGSCKELKDYTGVKVNDLHRDSVDQLEFTVKGEQGTYKRIPEVLDCWFESGSMPYAKVHYPFENKEFFKENFPAEFIAEGLDQTRGWFYTLTILSTALFQRPAFKNVIVSGMVMAEDGKKMSKRLKNYTPPNELMETFGADALRLYLINSGLVKACEQHFSNDGVKDMVRRVLLPWYNAFNFFHTYAKVDNWKIKKHSGISPNITDNWILSELQSLKKCIEEEMKGYRLYNVVPSLFKFLDNLTNWYIRLNRGRFWQKRLGRDKNWAFETLHKAVLEFSTLMAPFAPFLSEYIYRKLLVFDREEKEESIHLLSYPICDESQSNQKLEGTIEKMQQIILIGRHRRLLAKIKIKTPLSKLTIIQRDKDTLEEFKKLEEYIKSELNVKTIAYDPREENFISFQAKANLPILGKRFRKKLGAFKQLIENLTSENIRKFEEKGEIFLEGERFGPKDILIFSQAKEGTEAFADKNIAIILDIQLTDELLREGMAREIVNRIQKTRKEMNLNVDDRIHIKYQTDGELHMAFKDYGEYIKRETLAETLEKTKNCEKFRMFDIEGRHLKLSLLKDEKVSL